MRDLKEQRWYKRMNNKASEPTNILADLPPASLYPEAIEVANEADRSLKRLRSKNERGLSQ